MKPIFRTDPLLFAWHVEWCYLLLLLWSLACCYGCTSPTVADKQAADALAQEAAAASIDAHTPTPEKEPVVVPVIEQPQTGCGCCEGCTCFTVDGKCLCAASGNKCSEGCKCVKKQFTAAHVKSQLAICRQIAATCDSLDRNKYPAERIAKFLFDCDRRLLAGIRELEGNERASSGRSKAAEVLFGGGSSEGVEIASVRHDRIPEGIAQTKAAALSLAEAWSTLQDSEQVAPFYCPACKAWLVYRAKPGQNIGKCVSCGKPTYRTLQRPPTKSAASDCPTCNQNSFPGARQAGAGPPSPRRPPSGKPLNWFGNPKLRYRGVDASRGAMSAAACKT